MIAVCEPQCKGISHEKVNSGFLYGLCLTYPNDKILFFTETNHYYAIKSLLRTSGINVNNVILFPINFNADKAFSFGGIVAYYFLLRKIFRKLIFLNENRVFFLSVNPIILFIIKKLKQNKKFKGINCTFVLHGELEDIANRKYVEPYKPVVLGRSIKTNLRYLFMKIFKHPNTLLSYIKILAMQPFSLLYSKYSLVFKKYFRTKRIMMWQHSDQYKYVSLSPHVTENADKYLNTKLLNFNTIIMPIVFSKPKPLLNNKFIKFAVFGYGDSAQMYKMLTLLSKRLIRHKYIIKIISMDGRGTEGFANIYHVGGGKVLTRRIMEKAAGDVDVFINLYDKQRHRLGCSLSILESFDYLKPILHLSNPGYNYFNKLKKPIGFRVDTLNDFVDKMVDMIDNFPKYKDRLEVFRKNMLDYRKQYDIKNNLKTLKTSFTFAPKPA